MSFIKPRKQRFLAAALSVAMLTPTSLIHAASSEGPGAWGGDLWQLFLQAVLSIPEVSADINISANEEPFYIPQAKSHAITTFRNQSIDITLRSKHIVADEVDPQTLVYSIVSGPLHGTISGTPPNLAYTPDSGYTGLDEIVFAVDDSVDGSTEGTIEIKVQGSFAAFESGQVRPLAISSDSNRLYALNTPDGRLEIYDVSNDKPQHLSSVPVGLEPVAIALRNDNEAWVVNTLSDNVSIVDLSAAVPYVKRTLQVGDEPQDIVFAGPNGQRAFVSTAHRGQNSPVDFAPLTPGVDRADVWVFDAEQDSTAPLNIVTLFGMPPRGLAVSPDGKTVYAGIYKSGNQSTTVMHTFRLIGKHSTANGKPGPQDDASGAKAPNTGVIVRYDGKNWRDYYGTKWDKYVHFDLPDYDVFEIDAMADVPGVAKKHAHVGTSLFNLAVNPKSGAVYVSNLEARNELRYEGHGERSDEQTLRGRFIENRITVIKDDEVLPRNLNSHLMDSNPDGSESDNARSLALPLQMQVDAKGENLYVSAYGSSKVGVFSVKELEDDTFEPSEEMHIEVSGGGPNGLILDESRNRMFVLTRFDNGISTINLSDKSETQHVQMYNPEPDFIVEGRPFLYDARFSSGRGDASCGSCHLFGDMDGIAWDLGDPDRSWKYNTRDYVNFFARMNALRVHHPLKGPMLTQSFRGMEFQGPQHWRGDRTGGERFNGESLERAAFKEFREAFPGLLGRADEPSEEQLNAFADFVLQLRYPPNPIRNLDDTLTEEEELGRDTFFNVLTTGFAAPAGGNVAMVACNGCHEVDPEIERFGTSTLMSFEGTETSQDMKVAHLRNVYSRVGMFGQNFRSKTPTSSHMGDQVYGYGLSHDGAVDTIRTFMSINVFHVPEERLDPLVHFIMTMPSGLAPIVGQQVTLNGANQDDHARIDVMIAQAMAHLSDSSLSKQKCDLVVQGVANGTAQAWKLMDNGLFQPDRIGGSSISDTNLRALALQPGNSLTYLCAPPGTGTRLALDRDEDGSLNADDILLFGKAETTVDPANPFAEPEVDEVVDGESNGYQRERNQLKKGNFPDFEYFWAL